MSIKGKFQGVINPTTPIGSLIVYVKSDGLEVFEVVPLILWHWAAKYLVMRNDYWYFLEFIWREKKQWKFKNEKTCNKEQ